MAGGTARPAAEGEAGHEPGTGWPGPQVAALGRGAPRARAWQAEQARPPSARQAPCNLAGPYPRRTRAPRPALQAHAAGDGPARACRPRLRARSPQQGGARDADHINQLPVVQSQWDCSRAHSQLHVAPGFSFSIPHLAAKKKSSLDWPPKKKSLLVLRSFFFPSPTFTLL